MNAGVDPDEAARGYGNARRPQRQPELLGTDTHSFAEAARTAVEHDPVIEGMVMGEGFHLWVGEPGSCKTMAGLQAAGCIQNGDAFLGQRTRPLNVVYVLYEGQTRATGERLERQRAALAFDEPFTILFKPAVQLENDEQFEDLLFTVAAHSPCAVFVDPFRDSHGLDEVSDSAVLIARIRELERAADGPVVMLHHPSQDRKASKAHRVRGHGSLNGKADVTHWFSRADAHSPEVVIQCIKARDFEPPPDMDVTLDAATLTLILRGGDLPMTAKVRVLRILGQRETMSRDALKAALLDKKVGERNANKAISELIKAGEVVSTTAGLRLPTEDEAEQAEAVRLAAMFP